MPKRSQGRSSVKARDFDTAQATDSGPPPGDADEPPEAFVQWVQDQDAAGAIPSIGDVLAYVRARANVFSLASHSDDKLREIAARWLKKAKKILDSVEPGPLEPGEDSDRRDDD